jgi:hypothetical protein
VTKSFYQDLYKTENTNKNATVQILSSLLQISSKNNNKLLELISFKEINEVLKKLPNNKSPDTNRLSYKFYKQFTPFLLHDLTTLFNEILLKNTFSCSWKASNIVLIPKKSEDKALIQN